MRAWRSLLYVPANVAKYVATAHASGADAIVLDLEDAVAPKEKSAARAGIRAAAQAVSRDGADVVVRINRPLDLAIADIDAAIGPNVGALALPKVTGPEHLRLLAEHMAQAERRCGTAEGSTRIIAMAETAQAIGRLEQIASAHPRVIAMTLGVEDFATDLGVDSRSPAIAPFHALTVAACAATGIRPLGLVGSIAEFRDLEAFGETVARSRAFGYRGAACIHPAQVAVLNATFTPSADEIDRARTIVAAYDAAHANGLGAIAVDGRMIDVPIADRARALLASVETFPTHSIR